MKYAPIARTVTVTATVRKDPPFARMPGGSGPAGTAVKSFGLKNIYPIPIAAITTVPVIRAVLFVSNQSLTLLNVCPICINERKMDTAKHKGKK
jgi:hypothetical protein